jgi:hypothetical protein
MVSALLGLCIVFLVGAVAAIATLKLFWPARRREPGPTDNWEQRNDLRVPSLEQPQEAQDLSIQAAVAAQIIDTD